MLSYRSAQLPFCLQEQQPNEKHQEELCKRIPACAQAEQMIWQILTVGSRAASRNRKRLEDPRDL